MTAAPLEKMGEPIHGVPGEGITKVHKLKRAKYYLKCKMKYKIDSMISGVGRPL